MYYSYCLNMSTLAKPARFELVRSAASADGRENSSEEGSGSLHNSTKSASGGEPSSLCEHAQLVKTKLMPQGSSMKSGTAVSGTHAHLMRSTDDTITHAALYYSPPFCMIDIVWMYYILWVLLATQTFPSITILGILLRLFTSNNRHHYVSSNGGY